MSATNYQVLSTKYLVPGTRYLVEVPRVHIARQAHRETRDTAADMNKLLAAAAIELARFLRAVRPELLSQAENAFAAGGFFTAFFPADKVTQHLARLAELLSAARFLGRLRIDEEAKVESTKYQVPSTSYAEVFPVGVIPAEAVRYIRSLPVVLPKDWQRYVASHHRAAFTVSGIEQEQALRALRELIAESLEAGLTSRQFAQRAEDLLRNFEQIGARRLFTVYNTVVGNALSRGREERLADPGVRQLLPYGLFDAMMDSRVRPNHAALDGAIAPWNWWDGPGSRYRVKLGYNCRCELIGISRLRAEEMLANGEGYDATVGVPAEAGPDPGWERVM